MHSLWPLRHASMSGVRPVKEVQFTKSSSRVSPERDMDSMRLHRRTQGGIIAAHWNKGRHTCQGIVGPS